MRTCLVMGAAGYIGSYLVPHLQGLGYRVIAGARRPLPSAGGVAFRLADSLKPATLPPALAGSTPSSIWYTPWGRGRFSPAGAAGVKNFAAAARAAGVRRIVYLGAIQPEPCNSRHLNSRRYCGELFRSAGVPTVELRAGIIIGPGSAAFEVMRDLVYNLPMMVTPKWVRSRTPPSPSPTSCTIWAGWWKPTGWMARSSMRRAPSCSATSSSSRNSPPISANAAPSFRSPFEPRLSAWWLQFATSVPQPIAKALVGAQARHPGG